MFKETEFEYQDSEQELKKVSLSIFQAANAPSKPLSSLEKHEQNKILLSVAKRCLNLASNAKPKALHNEAFLAVRPDANTISKQGIDYSELESYLKKAFNDNSKNSWREANEQTRMLMLQALAKGKYEWIEKESMLNFPCDDLQIIDSLWAKYSNNKFGFVSQNKIWNDANQSFWRGKEFSSLVGWIDYRQSYKEQDELNFSIDAPQGHLPYIPRFSGILRQKTGYWLFSPISSRLDSCSMN